MKLENYQKEAARTCASLGQEKLNLAHMILGLVSEQEEFLKAVIDDDMVNACEEQADMCWYLANYCTFRGYDFKELLDKYRYDFNFKDEIEEEVSLFVLFNSKLADYVKKYIAYNKPINTEDEQRAIGAILYSLTLEDTGFNFEEDLSKNIQKLRIRFPEKFTQEKALNRDLKTEREVLEA